MTWQQFLAIIPYDHINGALESLGGFALLTSVIKLHRDKVVKGVSWFNIAFFATWGLWNLLYYPHLDQWLSFYGGMFLVTVNMIWLFQIFYYNWINSKAPPVDRFRAIRNPHAMKTVKPYRHSDK